jgi:hypothetical protein
VTIYGFSVGAWPFMYVGIWIHAQGAVSALCSLMKKDVSQAVHNFLCCRCSEEQKDETVRPIYEQRQRIKKRSSFLSVSGLSHPSREFSFDDFSSRNFSNKPNVASSNPNSLRSNIELCNGRMGFRSSSSCGLDSLEENEHQNDSISCCLECKAEVENCQCQDEEIAFCSSE